MVLAPITLSQPIDAWKWPLNPDGHFSTKPLLANMGDRNNILETSLARGYGKTNTPRNGNWLTRHPLTPMMFFKKV